MEFVIPILLLRLQVAGKAKEFLMKGVESLLLVFLEGQPDSVFAGKLFVSCL